MTSPGPDSPESLSVPPAADKKAPGIAAAEVIGVGAAPAQRDDRYPPGIPYIIGNEAAERFSYYGMRAILYVHMVQLFERQAMSSQQAATSATQVVALFFAGVYAFPMIGAILADRLVGKYRLILWVSLLYCAGHGMLAVAGSSLWGMYLGLGLIAMGSGGIKPCVSANVGDQFTKKNAHLIPSIYRIFYFSINFGSFFATLLIPWIKGNTGPGHIRTEIAFLVPGLLMALATQVFWLGRHKYVKVPPKPGGTLGFLDSASATFLFLAFAIFAFDLKGEKPIEADEAPSLVPLGWKAAITVISLVAWYLLFSSRQKVSPDPGFLNVLFYSFRNQHLRRPGMGFFDVARERFGNEAAEGPPAVLRIMAVFSMVSVFWALFDQHASTWVEQARHMDRNVYMPLWGEGELLPSQIQAANPLMVMIIIPLMSLGVYGPLQRRNIPFGPLLRMTVGMFITALSFLSIAVLQGWMDAAALAGTKIHVSWQMIPYVLLTVGEVLVSITGLEFAYTQAPRTMKSTIMGFWLLCVTIGNLLVHALAEFQEKHSFSPAVWFWIFTSLMAAAAVVFAILAYFYKGKTYLQDSA